ncbi:MAG: 50S ribosomal protein L4 [Candidatus Kerfeldbacteria bacterium]|nr:50S ribosomal protein L4 [Candidatus Kerfeldbacteria bacterium]
MPNAKVYNAAGRIIGSIELDPSVFGVRPKPDLIEQAVVAQLANRRAPLAHTKTRGEVRGGGRKPWRQKGTGRARQGSIRAPQWRGGGVVHGPRAERNFRQKMNRVAKRQALLMALSDKAQAERISVLESLQLPAAKTKHLSALLTHLPRAPQSLIILPKSAPDVIRAGRNIPGLTFIRADSLNVYEIMKHQQLLIERPALPVIRSTFVKS